MRCCNTFPLLVNKWPRSAARSSAKQQTHVSYYHKISLFSLPSALLPLPPENGFRSKGHTHNFLCREMCQKFPYGFIHVHGREKEENGGAFCTKVGGVRNGRGGIFFHIHMHANVFQNSPMIEKAFFPISIPGHFPPLFPSNSLLDVCAVLRTIGEGWGLVGGCGKRKRNSDRISSPLSPNVNSPFISSFFSPLLPTAYLA